MKNLLFNREEEMSKTDIIKRVTEILTNHNQIVVEEMKELAEDGKNFYIKYHDWCGEIVEDIEEVGEYEKVLYAYWTVGYNREKEYGAYIDWKENGSEIIDQLCKAIENLGYEVQLEKYEYDEEEETDEIIKGIDRYLMDKGYRLVILDTDSDSYHLYVIKANEFDELIEQGKRIKYRFYNEL